jgi:NAD+ kinase
MTVGVIGNIEKPNVGEVARKLLTLLGKEHVASLVQDSLASMLPKGTVGASGSCPASELAGRSELIIALGGDGTMLTAARLVAGRGIPILGINMGKLGFLAEVSLDEWEGFVPEVVAGHFRVEERMCLSTVMKGGEESFVSLNEIVIDRGSSPRVIELETYVDDEYLVTYSADGIIVTTPTGSTAYSLASGGPIIVPRSDVLTINPISPHSLTSRAVVIPSSSTVRIVVHAGITPVHITADGQVEAFYETPAEFIVRKAPFTVKLVKRKKHTYFETLRKKLFWGKDIRTEKPA